MYRPVIDIPTGQLIVDKRIQEITKAGIFDGSAYLIAHQRGEGGDRATAEEIFEHLDDVLKDKTVKSYWETKFGRLMIVTNQSRTRTVMKFI